jgi:flavin-dependent dehydrogenase
MPPYQLYDVVIVGGGLAGLTLARSLKQECRDTRVLVLQKWRVFFGDRFATNGT